MSKKVIKLKLSDRDIDDAVKQLANYKKWLKDCTEKFLEELGNEGVEIATAKFKSAEYDGTNDVSVTMQKRSDTQVAVVAVGTSVLFIEFGTGINNPNLHPEAEQNGFIHGQYGYGLGRLSKGWRYEGEPGTHGQVITSGKNKGMVQTKGNIANMSMYQTVRELQQRFEEIARRCYV